VSQAEADANVEADVNTGVKAGEDADAAHRAAVLGHPIAHSLSPVLHTAAYAQLGLSDWAYERHDVDETQLAEFMAQLDDSWAGLSLTMPLKKAVFPLLQYIEPLAEVTGSVNTVLFSGKGVARMAVGTNTDVYGVVQALREGIAQHETQFPAKPVSVVIGAGATAASAVAALAELGCTAPVVVVRSLGRTGELRAAAGRMGIEPTFVSLNKAREVLVKADLVVSTLPPHAADDLAAELTEHLAPESDTQPLRGVLLDVAYDPAPTALIQAWRAAGGIAVTGERMLLHQAVEQVRLMTGKRGPIDAMAAALERALAS